jgi:hypothetical protein
LARSRGSFPRRRGLRFTPRTVRLSVPSGDASPRFDPSFSSETGRCAMRNPGVSADRTFPACCHELVVRFHHFLLPTASEVLDAQVGNGSLSRWVPPASGNGMLAASLITTQRPGLRCRAWPWRRSMPHTLRPHRRCRRLRGLARADREHTTGVLTGATAYVGTTYAVHRAETGLRQSREQFAADLEQRRRQRDEEQAAACAWWSPGCRMTGLHVCLPLLGCLL